MDQHGHSHPPIRSADPMFERMYAQAGTDLHAVPWAALEPRPALTDWLDRQPQVRNLRALVVACGLGDDAEELARRGYQVTAFDAAPTAIDQCHRRFPDSAVDYQVADLFALPDTWQQAFDLVVEIWTLQSLEPAERPFAEHALAATVRPGGGQLFVYSLALADGEALESRPWPLQRTELRPFLDAGLQETEFVETAPQRDKHGSFVATYRRP